MHFKLLWVWSICMGSLCLQYLSFSCLTIVSGYWWSYLSLCRDLSSNNLSGELPSSMENLLSLTTLLVTQLIMATYHYIYSSACIKLTLLSAGVCRTISYLGPLMFYKIFPLKICTILQHTTLWFFLQYYVWFLENVTENKRKRK